MKYGHLNANEIIYAKNPVIIGNALIYNPTREQYLSIGEKSLHLEYPSQPAGDNKHWEEDGFEETATDIIKKWKAIDDIKIYRIFSKLSLEVNLLNAGVLDKFDRFLDETVIDGTIYNLRKFYNTALVLKEDNPMYMSYYEAAKNALGLTADQLEHILNNSISE